MFSAIQGWWLTRRVQREMRTGQYEQAVASLTNLLELRPRVALTWVKRAICYRQLQNYQAAYDDARHSLTILELDPSVWELAGQMLRKLDRIPEALAAFDRALEIDPGRTSVRLDRGGALHSSGRNREALVEFDAYVRTNPLSVDGYYLKAAAHEDLWEPDEGLAAVEKCLGLSPQAAAALVLKGRLLGMLKRPSEALTAFDAAIAAGYEPDGMIGPRTYQLVQAGRYQESLPYLQRLLDQWPSRNWYLCRARAYDGLGDKARAEADRRAATRFLQQGIESLRTTAVRRNAVLIQANHEMFCPGEQDQMSLVLLTFDDAWNADTDRMQKLASQLFTLKNRALSNDPVMRAAANAVSNDYGIAHRRQPIPVELTAGAQLYAADLNLYRDFLPDGHLTEATRVLPVLAEPGDQGRMEMLPWTGSRATNGNIPTG